MALFTVTAPSGAGKSTLVNRLSKLNVWNECISTTTRKARWDEKHGVNYYYITDEEFKHKLDLEEFAEWVTYDGNKYGVEHNEILGVLGTHKHAVIIVEHNGFKQIKEQYPDSVNIFLHMSKEDCMANMLLRGDSLEKATNRIRMYGDEMANSVDFDYVIKNVRDKQDATLQILTAIVRQYN